MKKIKFGCVGLRRGKHVTRHLLNSEIADVVAICDMNPQVLETAVKEFKEIADLPSLKGYTSFDEFLKSDVEAVFLATPIAGRIELVEKAMDAGKHVLCEIPAITSLEDAKKLKEIVNSHPNLKYMSAENCCYLNFVGEWKKLYEDGVVGDVFYAEADYLHDVRKLMEDDNGNLCWRAHVDSITYLTHDVGVLLYLLNDEIESVSAFTPDVKVTPKEYTGSSNQIGIFRTKKGAIIKMVAAFAINREMIHNYSIYGTKGTLERDRNDNWVDADTYLTVEGDVRKGVHDKKVIANVKENRGGSHATADKKMVEAFINCVMNDTPSPINVDMAINMSLAGIYGAKSAKEGGIPIKVPKI